MPINNPHPQYTKMQPKVTKVNDCYEGSDKVKSKKEIYTPRLDGQGDDAYKAYIARGLFLPVINPTATAFTGAIMRNEPVTEIPTNIDYLLTDTNNSKRPLSLVASMVLRELMIGGRCGGLVEHDGKRTKVLLYPFESIINWTDEFIVLSQEYNEEGDDEYDIVTKTEYLKLMLVEGAYTQEIWREDSKGWKLHDTKIPTNRGEAIGYIPFAVCNTKELSYELTNPALLEIADVNLDHYRLSTDLRHGLHYTALPTMFLYGDLRDEEGKSVTITVGAGSANHISDPSGRAELLEFTGAGLGAIENAMASDVTAMAAIGAKMLQNDTTGVKAAETARIEASGESATLTTLANSTEALITQLLQWCAEWEGSKEEVSFKLNRDYLDTKLDPQTLTALLATWQGGGMSLDTFLYNLQKGEILQKGADIETEKELIAEGGADDLDLDNSFWQKPE